MSMGIPKLSSRLVLFPIPFSEHMHGRVICISSWSSDNLHHCCQNVDTVNTTYECCAQIRSWFFWINPPSCSQAHLGCVLRECFIHLTAQLKDANGLSSPNQFVQGFQEKQTIVRDSPLTLCCAVVMHFLFFISKSHHNSNRNNAILLPPLRIG